MGTLMIEQNENNLGFLINMKGYIPLMKYYTFLGLIFFAVAFFSMWRSHLRKFKTINRLEEEKRELKATMYDLKKEAVNPPQLKEETDLTKPKE